MSFPGLGDEFGDPQHPSCRGPGPARRVLLALLSVFEFLHDRHFANLAAVRFEDPDLDLNALERNGVRRRAFNLAQVIHAAGETT